VRSDLAPIKRKLRELELMARDLAESLDVLPEGEPQQTQPQGGRSPLRDVKWVAEFLGITQSHVYYLVRTGSLPAIRLGRHCRFREDIVIQFLDAGGTRVKGHSILREVG
jgi:excisionase family DNA binding protein